MKSALALLALCAAPTLALDVLPEWARGGALADLAPAWKTRYGRAEASTYAAPLDWVDGASVNGVSTIDIRYWVDASKHRAGGPVFVSMGGEGTGGPSSCSGLCSTLGGVALGVEHRFYGKSLPDNANPLSNDFLKYLEVAQNLADTNAITQLVKQQYKTDKALAKGGSYSGATCAWFRQKYPDTVNGCISESGVVNTIWEYLGFDETIYNATSHPDAACPGNIEAATLALDEQFKAGNATAMKQLFNAPNLVDTKLGDSDFFYAVADGVAMIDQYGGKAELCRNIKAGLPENPTPMQRIEALKATIFKHYGSGFAAQCFYDSECLRTRATPVPGVSTGERSWRWQKCHNVGYLQAAPAAHPLRSPTYLTIEDLEEQCAYIFDMPAGDAKARNAAFTAEFYGKLAAEATNVFFINYSDDPWRASSPLEDVAPTLRACQVTCDGCGHCGSGASFAPSYKTCHDKSNELATGWLQ